MRKLFFVKQIVQKGQSSKQLSYSGNDKLGLAMYMPVIL